MEGTTNSRIHLFLPECIAFNQGALRHFYQSALRHEQLYEDYLLCFALIYLSNDEMEIVPE